MQRPCIVIGLLVVVSAAECRLLTGGHGRIVVDDIEQGFTGLNDIMLEHVLALAVRAVVTRSREGNRARFDGKLVAERAQAKGIKTVVFDRGGYLYTGRVQALAEAAREAGLEF